ncbi:MAG: hypothetical protein HYT03_02135 [Candidatus Harrisonbacteria bacterium]|nr:hypothetical protein [Candidatus Harrisonbacteria bacterium]
MKTAKGLFKIVFVLLVIFGLVASYVLFNIPVQSPSQGAPGFEGPTSAPSVKGPSGPPPTTE